MVDAGKIRGEKLVELLHEVVERKIILSMFVIGAGYERLTYLMGVVLDSDAPRIVVDAPDDFNAAVERPEALKLRFNFNGPDRLEYIFHTTGGELDGRDLYLPMPPYVERIQRRKNFRVDTPVGSLFSFRVKQLEYELKLINISLGGVLGAVVPPASKAVKRPQLSQDQKVYRASLFIPADGQMDDQTIRIRKAAVRRIERHAEKKLVKYAFEFLEIHPEEKEQLIRSIYHIQRQLLQRR